MWLRSSILVAVATCALGAVELDRFGGAVHIEREATGHFRVEKIDGRWMFVTPDGHGYVALGGNHVGKFLDKPEQSSGYLARFKNREAAETAMYESMRDLGLTAGEAYAPLLPSLTRRMPYVVNIDFPGRDKFRFDPWDEDWLRALREKTLAEAGAVKDDPFVLGIAFADLPVWNVRRTNYYRSLDDGAALKRRYVEFLRKKYSSVEAVNLAYGTRASSYGALGELNWELDAVREDDQEFLGIVAEELYRRLQAVTREAAPNKLFFGERFVLRMVPAPVLRAVGRYVDVFCTQALILSPQRPPEWQVFQPEGFEGDRAHVGDKPFMVIDWAAPFSLDTTYETIKGTVKAEKEASEEAALWLEKVFQLPYVIGVFKCQWIGSHGNDRWFPTGRMKRTYVRDDGEHFPFRTEITRKAHARVLSSVYGH